MSRRLTLTGVAGTIGLLSMLAAPAQAGSPVTCTFVIQEDLDSNVQAGFYRTRHLVRDDQVDKLVPSAPEAVRMRTDGENICWLWHAENDRLKTHVDTRDVTFDKEAKVPSCEDLKIRVMCRRG